MNVSSQQLEGLFEMFITLMFLRKVEPQYWFANVEACTKGIALAATVRTEALMCQADGMTDQAKETSTGAVKLSLIELKTIRVKMYAQLGLLRQMAPPGTKLN